MYLKNALIISGIFHTSLLVVAALDIPWFESDEDIVMQIIPVEMVDISEVTKTQEIAKLPEPTKDKPRPPERKIERAAALPPPPPKMASTMPLLDQPTEKPTVKPQAPVKRAEAPQVAPRSRPRPPSRFSADRLSALLNKIPEEKTVTERLAERYGQQEQQMTSLDVQRQTMSISAAIQKKIEDQCWNPPSGALDAGSLRVSVSMQLAPDGSLARPPEAEDYARMNGRLKVAADSALRAVRMCAPYSDLKLPKELYNQWKEIKMNFDPSGMIS